MLKNCRILFLLAAVSVHSFQSTTQSVNPFNKFMSPQNDVNLYTGTGNVTVPLNIPLSLSYSSNVTDNARSSNEFSQTSWCGLGWQLSSGSIIGDHKGTAPVSDDDYFWISPEGVHSKLLRPKKIHYKYYESSSAWSSLPNFSQLTPVKEGSSDYFNINLVNGSSVYGYVFETVIDVPYDGVYTFYLYSDDGSKLYIDNTCVVNHDGAHGVSWKPEEDSTECPECPNCSINLSKGMHSLKVEYFQAGGPHDFNIQYRHAQIPRTQLPLERLYYPGSEIEGKRLLYSEQNPYIRFQQITDSNGVCTGWIVTKPDGSKTLYGNLDLGEDRNATRYTFKSGNAVGNVTSGTPELYPYQWDLSEIRDIAGNATRFWYQQELKYIHSGSFRSDELSPPRYYTKASYLKEIRSPDGKKAVFTIEDKSAGSFNEPFDPYTLYSQPDGFIKNYESKRMSQIECYNAGSDESVLRYQFSYDFLNKEKGNGFIKSLLKSIKEYRRGKNGEHLYKTTSFEYCGDISKADSYEGMYSYGALRTIYNNDGTVTKFDYWFKGEDGSSGSILSYDYDLNGATDCPYIHGNDGTVLHGGTYDNGKEYILVQGGNQKDRIWIYTFDGHDWVADTTLVCKLYGGAEEKNIYVFNNTIVYTRKDDENSVKLIFWAENKWNTDDLTFGAGHHINGVFIGNDYIVFRGGDGEHDEDRIWIYRRYGNTWVCDYKYSNHNVNGYESRKNISTGNNFFVVKEDHGGDDPPSWNNEAWIFQWNGNTWDTVKVPYPDQGGLTFTDAYAGPNYVVFVGSNGTETRRDYIWIYYWDGRVWKYDSQYKGYKPGNSDNKYVLTGDGYFVFRKAEGTQDQVWVYTWDGERWREKHLDSPTRSDEWYLDAKLGPDYFILQGGSDNKKNMIRMYKRSGNDWDTVPDFNWKWLTFESTLVELSLALSNNAFAVMTSNNNSLQKVHSRIYTYDGTTWKKSFENSYPKSGSKDPSICVLRSGFGFATNADSNHLQFVHKFRDSYNAVQNYVVNRIMVTSYPDSNMISTIYNYRNGRFDAYSGIMKFNKVEARNSVVGKTAYYFFNDSNFDNQQDQNSDYLELDGLNYRTAIFDKNQIETEIKPVSSSRKEFEIFRKEYWPEDVNVKRVVNSESKTNGITNEQTITYNDLNGMPASTQITNSDGSIKKTRVKFAFEDTTYKNEFGVDNRYMLTQPCQTIVLGKTGTGTTMRPLAANAITYKNDSLLNCWLPSGNYVLNVKKKADGFTAADFNFQDFIHAPGANNPDWKYSGGVTRYSSKGAVQQSTDAINTNTVTITRSDNLQTISQIPDAKFTECGVFTGDYDLKNDSSFFDKENGWRKGAGNEDSLPNALSTVCEEAKHFGTKGVKVTNAFGPSRAFKLEQGKDYIFSAWIKKSAGNVPLNNGSVIGVDYRKCKSAEGVWPIDLYLATESPAISCNSNLNVIQHGDWYYIELPVNASQDISATDWNAGYQYASAWVGVPHGNGNNGTATVYIDDIRFYPKDALVTSTYYDHIFNQPVISIDANNNPGRRVCYDDFGRPVEWEKLDLSKRTDEAGYATPVSKKEYRLAGFVTTPVYTNDYETGNVDVNTGICGGSVEIVNSGYKSSHCLKVVDEISCYQDLNVNASIFENRCYVFKGYYKSDTQLAIQLKCANATEEILLNEQILQPASSWTEFNVCFSLSNITLPLTMMKALLLGDGYTLYLDDVNIGYMW